MEGSPLFLKSIVGMAFWIATSNNDCSNEHSLIHCKTKGSRNGNLKSFSKIKSKFSSRRACRRIEERGAAEIQAIGAGALNQAVKAVAIARGFVAPSGVDLICIPAFTDIQIDGEERTAIKLIVEPR